MAGETLDMILSSITTIWAQECVNKARRILNEHGITPTNNLLPATIESKQTKIGNGIRIDFYAADYYIFVDEGVKGIGGGKKPLKPTTGKYKFKTLGVSKSMQMNIS